MDPRAHLVEFPRLTEEGTILVRGRFSHDGTYLGEILESGNGTDVYTDEEGFIIVRAPGQDDQKARYPLPPPGHSFTFSFRYKPDGRFDASLWTDEESTWLPDGSAAGSDGRVELLSGNAPFGSSARIKIVFGQNYGFAGSLFTVTGTDRWVKTKSMKLAIIDGTFDFHRSSDASELLDRIETTQVASDGGADVISLTLRSPNERADLPVPRSQKG